MDIPKIEKKWQALWERERVFESEPGKRNKYFMLFAYPTVSGTLHVGHARSYCLPDVIARYKRMKGFNVFFPLGFHATGIDCQKILDETQTDIKNAKKFGISESDARKFKTVLDVEKYLEKNIIKSFKEIGISLDFRPIVSTIDPQYNKFIEWQFRQLKKLGYLIQTDYRLAWCPKCEHPVSLDPAEADISEWKGAQIKNYIIIKFESEGLIFPAATLRPETVFGVTNVWINPNAKYVKAKIDKETWIISKEAMNKLENLNKKIEIIEEFEGSKFANKDVLNPANEKAIPILEGDFVNPDEATGIVMSVPSHDPFDYIYLKKIAPEIEPVQVVEINGFGKAPAAEMLEKYKIKDPKDPKLEEVVKELYKIEFQGRMLSSIHEFGGMPVSKAKLAITDWLKKINASDWIYELSVKPVHCRCGTEVVIKSVEGQWFIDYGNFEWKSKVSKHIEKMNIYPPEYKNELPGIIDWMEARPCVRKRGIGTIFPFDKTWIIEAISDSTIYMAFFIVSKYFNQNKVGLEDVKDEFFDYVFLGKGEPEKNIWKAIRKEFEYWYPLDLNAIGKEHKAVHLPVFIFNHVAIFPERSWPMGIFVNWHLVAYGKKMSKHLGNVIFWSDAIEKYSADPIRLYLTHGSNQWYDFDWRNEECENYVKHVKNFYNLIGDLTSKKGEKSPVDKWLKSRINKVVKEVTDCMEKNEIRKAIDLAFFSILNDINWYKKRSDKYNVQEFIPIWIKMLTPFIPHTCEEIWSKLKKREFISLEKWPEFDSAAINPKVEAEEELIKKVLSDIEQIKKIAKIKRPAKITMFVSPQWKYEVYNCVLQNVSITYNEKLRKQYETNAKILLDYQQKLLKKKPLDELFLTAGSELKALKDAKEFFEKEFDCKVEIIPAEKSKHPKAYAAEPAKPGILIE